MPRTKLLAALAIVGSLATQNASAQSVEGKAVIDGRTVELLSDGTWRFVDERSSRTSADCDDVGLGVSFCGLDDGWNLANNVNPDAAAAYRYDDRHYGLFILEAVGQEDGMTAQFMRDTAIDAAGGPRAVTVLDTFEDAIDGEDAETLVYAFEINGLPVVYANTILSRPRQTFQIVTISIGDKFSATHRGLHERFLSFTRIE